MKSFLKLFLLLWLLTDTLGAAETQKHTKLPITKSLPLLQQIDSDAMILGDGPTEVYVFIDPMCPHSRNFVEMIVQSKKMQKLYRYHFFLYSLKRFHSEKTVQTLYGSKEPLKSTLDLMVYHHKIVLREDPEQKEKIARIAQIAQKLDVYKRPYLIMVKKPTKGKK